MPPSTTVKLPPQLVRQLRTFRRRLRTVKMLEAVCLAGIAVILSYALLYLSDRLWETPPAVGWLLFFIAVSGLAVFIPWWSFRWVWQRRTESQLARTRPWGIASWASSNWIPKSTAANTVPKS